MEKTRLFEAEYRLMEMIWRLEPVNSTELSRVCQNELDWKKSTTYTMLRKLAQRRILENKDAMVRSLIKREEALRYESEAVVDKTFQGSLPAFLSACLSDKRLTAKDAAEIMAIIKEASDDQ